MRLARHISHLFLADRETIMWEGRIRVPFRWLTPLPHPFTLRIARLLTTFDGSPRCFRSLRGFRRPLRPGSRGPSHPWHLADSRIPGDNELARAQHRLLEIRRIGRKVLPASDVFPEYLNRSHIRKLASKTFVVLLGGGEPNSVICRLVALVAENEDNLVLNVNREAAKHGASPGQQRSNRVQHKLVGYDLAMLGGEERVAQKQGGRITTRLRHRTHDIAQTSGRIVIPPHHNPPDPASLSQRR